MKSEHEFSILAKLIKGFWNKCTG